MHRLLLAVAAAALLAPASAQAFIPVGNLLRNPGAEDPPVAGNGSDVVLPYWNDTGIGGTGSNGDYGDPFYDGGALARPDDAGEQFFVGGDTTAVSTLEQTVSVAGASTEIDNEQVSARLSAYLGGNSTQNDYATVTLTFLDGSGFPLGTQGEIGPVTLAERGFTASMLRRSLRAEVPALTRSIRVTLTITRVNGTTDDGVADNINLTLTEGDADRLWDLGEDFRPASENESNPNPDKYGHAGTWRYEVAGVNGTNYTLLPDFVADAFGIDQYDGWYRDGGSGPLVPYFLRHSGAPQDCPDGQADCSDRAYVLLHPDIDADLSATWVSPINGDVTVRGSLFEGCTNAGDGVLWQLRDTNEAVLASGSVSALGEVDTFTAPVSVAQNDRIRLVLSQNAQSNCDFAIVRMAITTPFANCDDINAVTDNGPGDLDAAAGTITTGAGADTIVGSPGADVINAGDGDDLICGRGGDDTIAAGDGADSVDGQGGADTIDGGTGDDTLRGGSADASTDRMRGGFGADTFDAGVSDPGIDRVLYDDAGRSTGVSISAGSAGLHDDGGPDDRFNDHVATAVESVTGSALDDQVTGAGAVNHTFFGGAGADGLDGGEGSDFLAGGFGDDTFTGGDGSDRVTYHLAGYPTSGGVTVTNDNVPNDGVGGEADNVTSDVEVVFGSEGNDVIDLSNYEGMPPDGVSIAGYGGGDTFTGTDGDDYFDGGAGTDTVDCVGGTDLLVAMDGPNTNCDP